MQKPSFNPTVLILTISILTLSQNFYSLSTHAISIPPIETFTLQIDNELETNPDKVTLCENSIFRKGWDGSIKGRIVEENISINSRVTLLYGSATGTDCSSPQNNWKKVIELNPSPRKYALNGDTLNITLTGNPNIKSPVSYLSPELATPPNSISPNNKPQIKIVSNPDLQSQPQVRSLCVDGTLLTETVELSSIFSTSPGLHKIKFAPTTPMNGAISCAQVSDDYAQSITVVDGKQTNIIAQSNLDYKNASVSRMYNPLVIKHGVKISEATIGNLDPNQTGTIIVGMTDTNSFESYQTIFCDSGISQKIDCVKDIIAKDTSFPKKLIGIEYDLNTSQADDELIISDIPVSQLFGGVNQSPGGVVSPKDVLTGLPSGRLLQNPISLALKNKNGHVTLNKRTEILSVVSKSSVNGEHIKSGNIKGLVSNSPFISAPTTYTVNAKGDYIFSSSISSAVGQYVLIDTAETPNDPAVAPTTIGLIRTGGESNQNKNDISVFTAILLGICTSLALSYRSFKKK